MQTIPEILYEYCIVEIMNLRDCEEFQQFKEIYEPIQFNSPSKCLYANYQYASSNPRSTLKKLVAIGSLGVFGLDRNPDFPVTVETVMEHLFIHLTTKETDKVLRFLFLEEEEDTIPKKEINNCIKRFLEVIRDKQIDHLSRYSYVPYEFISKSYIDALGNPSEKEYNKFVKGKTKYFVEHYLPKLTNTFNQSFQQV